MVHWNWICYLELTKRSHQLLSRMKLAQHFASKLTKLCNTPFDKVFLFFRHYRMKKQFWKIISCKTIPSTSVISWVKSYRKKTITKAQRVFVQKCCYWYAYIAIESLRLLSHNGKMWKGTGAEHWITSSPTVPSSLLGMWQMTFPCLREIWNLAEFSSTAQEKCMMHFSLQE